MTVMTVMLEQVDLWAIIERAGAYLHGSLYQVNSSIIFWFQMTIISSQWVDDLIDDFVDNSEESSRQAIVDPGYAEVVNGTSVLTEAIFRKL